MLRNSCLWDLSVNEALYGFDLVCGAVGRSEPEISSRQQQAITRRMAEYYHQAKKLLTENRALLDSVAEELSVRRYLIGNDIRRIRDELYTMKEAS